MVGLLAAAALATSQAPVTEMVTVSRLPVTPIEAFQQARAAGAAKRTGFASVDGHRAVRYTQGSIVWLVEPGSGRLLEERVTERGTRRGQRFVARQRIRILAVRRA